MALKGVKVNGTTYPFDYNYLDNLPSNLVQDANYVHTDNNFSNSYKTKLNGIENQANKTVVDSSLSSSSTNPVQNKVVKAALDNKAEIDGYYEDLTAGNAEQLVATVGVTDKVPYNFRTSGGAASIGNRETDKLVGGTIAWNQAVNGGTEQIHTATAGYQSVYVYRDGNGSILESPIPNGHKYLALGWLKTSGGTTVYLAYSPNNITQGKFAATYATEYTSVSFMGVGTDNSDIRLRLVCTSSGETVYAKNVMLFDLTQMFGSTIADYIYSLEQANAGAGVAWFRKLFPKPYYAYNAGHLLSVKASAHEMVGFNAWDEQWEIGGIDFSTGQNKTQSNTIRPTNYIPVIAGANYYVGNFKSGSGNSFYLFYYDANKNFIGSSGGYILSQVISMSSDTHYVRFQLPVAYGTTYNNDICINLSWSGYRDGEYEPYVKHSYALDSDLTLRGIPKLGADNRLYYDGDTYASDGTVTRRYEYRAYESGDEMLADAITDGTHTVVKLATPTTETADPYQNPQIVDDFGTEEYVDTRDVPVPVGHDTFYQANLRDKLQNAPESPNANGDYIMRRTASGNAYVALPSAFPSVPSSDGTYVLKATVSGGTTTLAWVAE